MPELAVSVLAYAPPRVAKEWAQDAAAPAEVVASRPVGEFRISNARWVDAGIVNAIAEIARRQGEHPRERALLDTQIRGTDWAGAGVNSVRRVTFHNDNEAYHKPFSRLDEDAAFEYGQERPLQPIHEVAAWQLVRELGSPWEELVPPCVLHVVDGAIGSLSFGVPGGMGGLRHVSRELVERAGFFDALTGQQDRHEGNYLIDGDRLHLIDHGFAFALPGGLVNQTHLHHARRSLDPVVRPEELAALRKMLDSPDLLGLGSYLEEDRADALRVRAHTMLSTGLILDPGDFGEQ